MVEHIMRDPSAVQISESEVRAPTVPARGLCLVCGDWVDAGQGDDLYAVTLDRGGETSDHVAHVVCISRVAHASARLPRPGREEALPQEVPENYLAAKFRTPSGR